MFEDRKVREDNLKAIEDEANYALFPAKNDNKLTPINELWKKGMEKKAAEDVQEEVDSLSDDGRYDVTISFENLSPEVVSWLMGKMNSYIHMARVVDIEPVTEARKGWRHALQAYDEPNIIFED